MQQTVIGIGMYDLVIIGGGPVGLFAAFYAGCRRMKTALVESADELGGQPLTLYPEKDILDMPGFPAISGIELSQRLIQQAQSDQLTVMLQTKVISYTGGLEEGFQLTCRGPHGDEVIQARAILITSGIGNINPRLIEAEGEQRLKDKGIYYYLQDRELVRKKRVVVVGGGDSALDWISMLQNHVSSLHLVHRRAEFRAHEQSVQRLHQSGTELHLNAHVSSVLGEDWVTGVEVTYQSGEIKTIDCDILLVAIGFHIELGGMANWPLEMDNRSIIVKADMETNIPGIFAAGDVATAPGIGNSKLIVIGMAQGTIAVNTVKTRIDPTAKFFPGHSTNWKS